MVYNSLNVKDRPKNYKVFTQPSQTVPDQSMSIKEILIRHANGLDLGGGREPIYEEEETNGVNPKTLDLVDFQRIELENQELIKDLTEKQKRQQEKRDQEKRERESKKQQEEKEFNDWKNQQNP